MPADPSSAEVSAADRLTATIAELIPRLGQMGVEVLEARPGFVRATVPFEGNGNHFGVVYAGVVFSVAEVLGGAIHFATFDTATHYPLVRSVSIDFRAPGTSRLTATASMSIDEIERIKAEAQPGAKVAFVLETEVLGEDGTLVATTRGDYQLRPLG